MVLALALLPLVGAGTASAAEPYSVLVFTKNATAGAAEGVAALQAAAPADATFDVSADASKFTDAGLAPYEAVVFLNTSGDVLDDAQQTAFEKYYRAGGGFLAIGSAIETEPDWQFFTNALGTRASGAPTAAQQATIKVADRGHAAGGKALPEYWQHTDRWYSFTSNVRGKQHVIGTLAGGAMEVNPANGVKQPPAEHPIIWCQDYQGGRAFYTGVGATAESFASEDLRKHLAGAVTWAAGKADAVYSDCGATVLANYQQTKISAPPNLNEPIGFDQLPDGRIIQTARAGQVRLHDPKTGDTKVIANFGDASLPTTLRVYTNSEDGLYGPAVDNDFATNKWVYIFYAPQTVRIEKCDGTMADVTTPTGSAPTVAADPCIWQDVWGGYFQLSRFKFVDGENPTLDFASEQKIMQVPVNRGACCHVAGDIDFDKHNNLWLVTGDDTPAGGGNSGGFSPHNDQLTNETQVLRVNGANGGTFTLTFGGQQTAAIAYNATAATIQSALEALDNIQPGDIAVTGGPVNTANVSVNFRGSYAERDVSDITGDATGLTASTGTPSIAATTAATAQGGLFNTPHVDARRSSLNTNDLRGKVLRIKVAEDGSYTVPEGNLFPAGTAKTRPEIYAMGFRNPFRIQVDSNDVAYVTDYSPDSNTPQNFRGPAGTGRVEVVRKPANYGWPLCYAPDLPYYRWNFNTSTPLDATPTPHDCDDPERGPRNDSRWNLNGGPTVEAGLEYGPPITKPDLWYSYRDNANPPLGTPCLASYDGSNGTCPQLFPELFTGGVAPHGAAAYEYDASNPNATKFPPYYDGSMILGEFGQDTLREVRFDSQNRVFKINRALDCGATNRQPTANLPFECDNPMDMQFGADGAFYLLTYGDGFFAANADAGMYKWEYVKGQRAPQAVLNTNKTDGPAPLTVEFDSNGTRDADPGDALTYEWDIDSDGTVDSTQPQFIHTYTRTGVYTAKLTVKDSSGKQDVKTTVITVGNTSPVITIETPIEGGFFEWGQHIPYKVTITDAEDSAIDCSKVRVTFVLLHDQHGHGEDEKLGCSGFLTTLAEDAAHGGYIAGGISVEYTDNPVGDVPALTTVKQTIVQARRQQVEYAQQESGTTVAGVPGGESDPGGGQIRSSLDPGDYIALNNRYNLTGMNKTVTFRYAGGANGVAVGTDRMGVEIRSGSPTGPVLQTVTLKSTGTNNNTYTSQTFPLDFAGSQQLFLVFRSVTGGPATGLGNLNWVEFGGDGIGVPADTAPSTALDIAPQQSACGGSCIGITRDSVFTLTATDDLDGARSEYRVDGGDWTAYTAPFKLSLTGGSHTLEYRSVGADGNEEAAKSVNLVFYPSSDGTVGGSVPATLSLTLGAPAQFGAFTPGVARDYTASTTAVVTSTAGDATLSVADPSSTHTGHLVNGSFFLPQKLQANVMGSPPTPFAPVGGSAAPTALHTYTGPVSNDQVTIGFKQSIGANDALRTGAYGKTLTFTLSTTTP
jgi:PKD repeat protein/glucose/arabinose dehydrogenase